MDLLNEELRIKSFSCKVVFCVTKKLCLVLKKVDTITTTTFFLFLLLFFFFSFHIYFVDNVLCVHCLIILRCLVYLLWCA